MAIDKSPGLEQFKDGIPEKMPDVIARRKKFRLLLLVSVVIVLMLGALYLAREMRTMDLFAGTGNVRGHVVDAFGQPFQGEVFILGTDLATQTDESGNFVLSGVPSGNQLVIVADELIGQDFTVFVNTASEVDMGQLRFESTVVPSAP